MHDEGGRDAAEVQGRSVRGDPPWLARRPVGPRPPARPRRPLPAGEAGTVVRPAGGGEGTGPARPDHPGVPGLRRLRLVLGRVGRLGAPCAGPGRCQRRCARNRPAVRGGRSPSVDAAGGQGTRPLGAEGRGGHRRPPGSGGGRPGAHGGEPAGPVHRTRRRRRLERCGRRGDERGGGNSRKGRRTARHHPGPRCLLRSRRPRRPRRGRHRRRLLAACGAVRRGGRPLPGGRCPHGRDAASACRRPRRRHPSGGARATRPLAHRPGPVDPADRGAGGAGGAGLRDRERPPAKPPHPPGRTRARRRFRSRATGSQYIAGARTPSTPSAPSERGRGTGGVRPCACGSRRGSADRGAERGCPDRAG